MFPEGSRVVPNPNGTAPGIDLEVPRPAAPPARIFCLPGVPAEMREMWHQTLVGALRGLGAGGRTIRQRRIKCFGAGESQIEAKLPDLIRRGRIPRVGINASQATIILRITAEGATAEECYAAMQPTAATIYETLGNLVYGEEEDEIQDAVVKLLRRRKQTLATLEWGTAGLVADWLGATACGDAVYRGGVIVSSETALEQVFDLPTGKRGTRRQPDAQTRRHGDAENFSNLNAKPGLSSDVLAAAASACRDRFAADYGLAIGPFPPVIPGSAEPEPVHIALAGPGGPAVKALPFAGHPDLLRALFAKHALNMLRLAISGGG
jgi:nicotinamide-nucleotide amidase